MDSFVISITNGITIKKLTPAQGLIIAFSLSVFQTVMPVIGWFAGVGLKKYIMAADHWIAFVLLSFIGIKMMYDGFTDKSGKRSVDLKMLTLFGQSLATSVDALVVGFSFAFIRTSILVPVLVIGSITFLVSVAGLYLGKLYRSKTGKKLEVLGGLILLGIGIKILMEHLGQ